MQLIEVTDPIEFLLREVGKKTKKKPVTRKDSNP